MRKNNAWFTVLCRAGLVLGLILAGPGCEAESDEDNDGAGDTSPRADGIDAGSDAPQGGGESGGNPGGAGPSSESRAGAGTAASCAEACAHMLECGLPLVDEASCLRQCERTGTPTSRDCVAAAACDVLPECFAPEADPDAPTCADACAHLAGCDVPGFDAEACESDCEWRSGPEELRCVIDAACDATDACFAPPPPGDDVEPGEGPTCADACAHMASCDLPDFDLAACETGCRQGSRPEALACVVASDCASLPSCFPRGPDDPGPVVDCDDVCGHLAACAAGLFDVEACAEECGNDDDPVQRQCVIHSECVDVGRCFGDEPGRPGGDNARCSDACDGMIACEMPGLETDSCRRDCAIHATAEELDCVLSSLCDSMPGCFSGGGGPGASCRDACANLSECAQGPFDLEACGRDCLQAADPDQTACVARAQCAQLPQCFAEGGGGPGGSPGSAICEAVCGHMAECSQGQYDVEACVGECQQTGDAQRATCVLQSQCAQIPRCFEGDDGGGPSGPTCQAACARLGECAQGGQFDPNACVGDCEQAGDPAQMACVMQAECAQVPQCFQGGGGGAPGGPSCEAACTHMNECAPGPFDPQACVNDCRQTDDPRQTTCVTQAECGQIGQCFQPGGGVPPAPTCDAACARLGECAQGPFDVGACGQQCQQEGDPQQMACVMQSQCAQLSLCFQGAGGGPGGPGGGPTCDAACARLGECAQGQFDPQGCAQECQQAGDPQQMACVMQAQCEQIPQCFQGDGPGVPGGPTCEATCARLEECAPGPFDAPSCTAACGEQGDPQQMACVLQAQCEQINECFPGAPPAPGNPEPPPPGGEAPSCDDACARMADCGEPGFDIENCQSGCLGASTPGERACIATSACETMSQCFGGQAPGNPEPAPGEGCREACGRLAGCELPGFSPQQCAAGCEAADDPAQVQCVLEHGCEDVGTCFGGG